MTRKVYIAGPMTGLPNFNYPAFNVAEEMLLKMDEYPVNPARNFGGRIDQPREAYLKTALRQLMKSDAVMVLDKWEESAGARLEVRVANELGIPVYSESCLLNYGMVSACEILLAEDGTVKWPSCAYGNMRKQQEKKDFWTPPPPAPAPKWQPNSGDWVKTAPEFQETWTTNPCGDEDCSCQPNPNEIPESDLDSWECGDCGAMVPGGLDWCEMCGKGWLKEKGTDQKLAETGKECAEPHDKTCKLPSYYASKFTDGTDEAAPLISVRAATLDEAKRLVTGDRNAQYGPPTQDFNRTADLLTALGYHHEGPDGEVHAIKPSDIAIIMAQLKVSRLMHARDKMDSWVDLAGYAACGAECAQEADE